MVNDIFILNQLSGTYPDGEFELSFGSQMKATTGIQKMVTRYLLYFLTAKGSELTDSEYGTNMATYIGGNKVSLLTSRIRLDLARTAIALKEDQEGVPPEEALERVELLDIDATYDTINISLRFTSQAQETITVKVPTITG